jgi:uncharacterized membrane protein YfcA
MPGEENHKEVNWWRVFFAIFYFLLGTLLIIIFRNNIFYLDADIRSWDKYRYIWCIASSCIGFSCIAFVLRKNPTSPFPSYLTNYPLQLLAMSALVFALLNLSTKTSNYIFYYFSFALCFTLGFLVDSYWSFVTSIVEITKQKLSK